MKGKDLFLGMNYIDPRYIEEAENVTRLNTEKRHLTLRRPVLIAALVALLLMLVGCGTYVYLTLASEPWSSIPEVQGSDVLREDIHVTVQSVSPAGIQLQCDIDGFGTEEKSIIMLQYAPFLLEKQTEDGWEEVPKLVEDPDWTADRVLTDGHFRVETSWATVYGYLDAGIYRITLEVVEGQEPFTLEFEITGDMRTKDLELAEDLVNREYWHVRETGYHTFGSLENVPEEIWDQFQGPFGDEDDVTEYWKYGENFLCLYYDEGELEIGMMFKDGVKYSLVREQESNDSPIVGWMPWPDLDLDRLTGWASYIANELWQQELTYRADGTIEKAVFTLTENDDGGYDVEQTSVRNLEFPDTTPEEIARMFEEQNTNVWQAFSWEEDQQKYQALDVAFVNTTPQPVTRAEEAVALANQECTVEATRIKIYRDVKAGIWKIEYQILYGYQGYQYIYLNDDGITVMVSGAGSKVEEWKNQYPDP